MAPPANTVTDEQLPLQSGVYIQNIAHIAPCYLPIMLYNDCLQCAVSYSSITRGGGGSEVYDNNIICWSTDVSLCIRDSNNINLILHTHYYGVRAWWRSGPNPNPPHLLRLGTGTGKAVWTGPPRCGRMCVNFQPCTPTIIIGRRSIQ